jgi:hypothetical protein
MSSPPFLHIDEFDGTDRFVRTRAFVNYTIDLNSHTPNQKVMLGNRGRGDIQIPCVVFNAHITLEEGCGYEFGGLDNQWDAGEEIQLKLHKRSWANKFYDPNDE